MKKNLEEIVAAETWIIGSIAEEYLEITSLPPRQDLSEDGTCSLDSPLYSENGFPINYGENGAIIVETNGDIVTAACRFYDTVEITRIKGTFSFEKSFCLI